LCLSFSGPRPLLFFWELMIVPMYLLIAIWGHENRTMPRSSFSFSPAERLMMLLAMPGTLLHPWRGNGIYTSITCNCWGCRYRCRFRFWLMLLLHRLCG
jgi:NADH-quinone oxidoreductase subunit M